MNRFPEKYVKPELISLDEGLNRGWSAVCRPEGAAATTFKSGDGFIDPEILQQSL